MGNTKEMYSWWWDSHISPKNSKWLLDNLTDMDSKVITMIKIIEVDEDSFARRAEMYYEKRPELMKLLEEIYRAYRALAERYDHATGVIRQAHKTMADAFPNQVPFLLTDDGPVNDTHDSDRCAPEIHAPIQASFDFDELKKDSVGLSSSHLFEKRETVIGDHNGETQILSETERLGRSETDVQALKEALSKLEAEKEAGLIQYKETLDRLLKLESEVLQAKEDSKGLNERASEAEARVQSLKETLEKVEAEKEASLHEYRQCLERISTLESSISHAKEDAEHLEERASKAERESEIVKEELLRVKAEKDTLLSKYMQALEKIANLENRLLLAEGYASQTSERADGAEKLVESLKVTIAKLTEEKEAAVLNHEKCLAKIATLECEIIVIQERAEKLKVAVEDGNAKLKGSEEQCLVLERSNKSLHSEVEWLEQKLGTQNQELAEKQRELGRLWTCLQEERMRFMETEASFKSLQNMHSKVQEELRFVASDLHKKVQLLKDLENQKLLLEDEVKKVKDENKSLSDINLSSEVSVRSMEEQIIDLKEAKGNLEQELNRHHDQKNDLQQEVHSLKEELSSLSARHKDLSRQVESLGFNFKSFGSSVIELRNENSESRESFQKSEIELADVKEKLTVMEKLIERNELLEKSLSNLNAELEAARRRVKDLEGSFQLLLGEKSTLVAEKGFLISQLRIATENIEKLSDHNTFLENSLLDANAELDMLRMKCMNLEDSCMLLDDHTSDLIMEKRTLKSELDTAHSKLEELGKKHTDLEQRFTGLEEERESTLCLVQELQLYLDIEKQEHANSNSLSQTRVDDLENKIHLLQEAADHMREEFEEELDKAVNAQLEIFILKKCIHDLNEKNYSLLKYTEKLLEASRLSEKLISELEIQSIDKQDEVRMLSSEVQGLRKGMFRLLEALEASDEVVGNDYGKDQKVVNLAIGKLDEIKASLHKSWDENHELVIEKSVFLAVVWQLKQDVLDLNTIIHTLEEEVKSRNGEVIILQKEIQKLLESNEELLLKVREGSQNEVILLAEMDGLREKLFHMQGAYGDLQEQNCKVIEEKRCLMKEFEDLEEEKHNLEDECSCMVGEVVSLDNLSFIFNKVISEKSKKVMELARNIDKLRNDNNILEEKARTMERNLEESRNKNVNYELSLKKTEDELEEVRVANDKLNDEIAKGSCLLCLKEKELQDAETRNEYKEKQILELSTNYAGKLKECVDLHGLIKNLESDILMMQKEHEESEARIQVLSSELQEGKDEARLWESVAGVFFTELQSCSVREALIKEKFSELLKAYEKLEEESRSKCEDIVQLKERVGTLEGENSEVKARLAADLSAILSLKDSLASLEKHASWPHKIHKLDNEEKEDIKSIGNSNEEQQILFANLQKIQTKIQDVEKAVIELKQAKQQAEDQNSRVNAELDSALRQIKLLKSQNNSCRGSGRLSGRAVSHPEEKKPQKNYPGISHREDKFLMKDIVLDQISDASSYGKNKRVTGSDDQIFELWENIDQAGSIDLTVNKPSRSPPSESMAEKELRVDDQQLNSKRFHNPELEDKKRKTLERLASDVQKLTNLQITVQALKEKLEMTENSSSKAMDVDCDGVKDQLLEIESTILKLFEYSSKIMKNIENSSAASSFDGSVTENSPEGGGGRRRRYLEQARRISEKIGRLQLDVQKLQFLLMKLNNNVGKGGTRVITERTTQVLLRDYLNSGLRTPRRRKRAHFCGCVKPRTKGD